MTRTRIQSGCRGFAIALLLMILADHFTPAQAIDREELRELYSHLPHVDQISDLFSVFPSLDDLSNPGKLSDQALNEGISIVNFLRALAGLEPVALSELYTMRSQHAAYLLAINDTLTHTPDCPENMNPEMYRSGFIGAGNSCLAMLSWQDKSVLSDGITYFARDDGEANLDTLCHRRWLLDPCLNEVGLGLAFSAAGRSYITLYVSDETRTVRNWDYVVWPSAGFFPVELMRAGLAWSVSLNDSLYDLTGSDPVILLSDSSGICSRFSVDSRDYPLTLSLDPVGAGSCLIFQPVLADYGINEYTQNQIWNVRLTGLRLRDSGEEVTLEWNCRMISLNPQEVTSVELCIHALELSEGESHAFSASVLPEWADNLGLKWFSSDPEIAGVDEKGNVTALRSGECVITVQSSNNRTDSCSVIVR